MGSSWTRDQTCVSCNVRCIPNHWTTREVPRPCFLPPSYVHSCPALYLSSWYPLLHNFVFLGGSSGYSLSHSFGPSIQFLEITFCFNINLFFTEALGEIKCPFGKQTLSVCGVNHFDVARSRACGYSKEVLDRWFPSGRLFGEGWSGRLWLADICFYIQNG